MKENQQSGPNSKIMQLCVSFANTNVIYTLVKSGVLEQMRDSPKTLEQISLEGKYNPMFYIEYYDMLQPLILFLLAVIIIQSQKQESSSQGFSGKFVRRYDAVRFEPWQKSWNNLSYSLETGKEAFEYSMGEPFFNYLNQHPNTVNPSING